MGKIRLGFLLLIVNLYFTSCEKKEQPIALPPQGDAVIEIVHMGNNYENQIYYDFGTQSIVKTSEVASWDISFEAGATDYHVFLNGGKEIVAYNTGQTDITKVLTIPENLESTAWVCDKSCGLADSSAIGEWRNANKLSKGEVYILKINPSFAPDTFKKIVINSVSGNEYVLSYSDLRNNNVRQIRIPKDADYNYSYFAFGKGEQEGSIAHPEPPKTTWDIVFTGYLYMYYKPIVSPYPVRGALLNPYNTTGFMDSTKTFNDIDHTIISPEKFSNFRDVVGSWWKEYSIDKGVYTVFSKRIYIIKTHNNEYWKLHFLGYTDEKGMPGNPNFEFKRIL